MTRVVLLGLDGFPHRAISPEITPRMWAFGRSGGRAPQGGLTDLPSSTDPGFCSLLTGCHPATHGVRTTSWRFARLPEWAGAETPVVATIFAACGQRGIRTASVVSDDRGLLATSSADQRWPPDGGIPAGIALDAHGYPANREVLRRLLEAVCDPTVGFVFGHFNEADTVGHDHGPQSEAARDCYTATDRAVGDVLDALGDDWDQTIVVIVSDHDMQPRDGSTPIDLMAQAGGRWDLVIPDGGGALVHLRPGVGPSTAGQALAAIEGIETWMPGNHSMVIAGARPGRIFSAPRYPAAGFHGAPCTARTVALVGGGHPAVSRLGSAIARRRPHLADWAPSVGPILGVDLPWADGVNLLADPAERIRPTRLQAGRDDA